MTPVRQGVLAMLGACLIWGFMPVIYKPLAHIPSEEVFAHRVLWSLVFFALILVGRGRLGGVRQALATPSKRRRVLLAAAMMSVNWFLLIFATALGRNTETSLGYYIYPLIAVFLGRVIFGERMSLAQGAAVGLATLAVLVLAIGQGTSPWIALALGGSFAIYNVVKKTVTEDPQVSVTAELLVFLPVVIGIFLWLAASKGFHFGEDLYFSLYMMVAGPVSAFPLILFSFAAKRVAMKTLGVMQYINPSMQFFSAVVLFAEPFTGWHMLAFAMIWTALVIYTLSAWRQDSRARRQVTTASALSAVSAKPSSDGSANP